MSKRRGDDWESGMTTEEVRGKPELLKKIYLGWASGESYSALEKRYKLRGNSGNTAWRCCRLLEKNHRVRKQTDRTSEKVQQLVAVLRAPAATLIEENRQASLSFKPSRSVSEETKNRVLKTNLRALVFELERMLSTLKKAIG